MQTDLHWTGKGEVGTMRRSTSDAVLEYLLANYGAAKQALVNINLVKLCWLDCWSWSPGVDETLVTSLGSKALVQPS
jgi:hypothetical protein